MYDLDENLLRRIKKEYRPVDYPEDEKKAFLDKSMGTPAAQGIMMKVLFPKYYPAIQHFFLDDEGRLFVMTHEKWENPKEFMFDIFNPEGIFIGGKSLRVFLSTGIFEPGGSTDFWVVKRHNRFFCLREKENGFKEFVVYRVSWE
ncbi:MAG: hypothetical protein OEY18_14965 [Candidatus Aminicenantes bacterium]|nr:hypothetical protein [Candidatus Aminicenantes bacterium]MDH5386001.1 hypothetical protein [Candidatus Aminicenantes bacterium]MDH5744690.1 hypothetical protein [Candidatus Aminicenantes bacterium]